MKLPVFNDPVTKQPSVSLTVLVLTFTTVIGLWLLGGHTLFRHTFRVVTTAEIDAWLGPVFLLYFGRGATKAVETVQLAKIEGRPTENSR